MAIGTTAALIGSAALGAGASMYGSKKQASAAKAAAKSTVPVPYGSSGPAGTVGVDPRTKQFTFTQADNPFAQIFEALGLSSFANAASAPGAFLHGADPELASAYQGLFGQGLTDEIQGQYDLLSQIARPGEQRAQQALDSQLFARGQLGTTGGVNRFQALQEALGAADLQRQLAAIGLGRQTGLDRFTGAQGAVAQGMGGARQAYDIGAGAFGGQNQLLQNLFQQAGLGVGAGGGVAPNAAMASAAASGVPYQVANQFLQNSGAFDALGRLFSGGGGGYPGVPMVPQPNLGPINVSPGQFPVINGNFGL